MHDARSTAPVRRWAWAASLGLLAVAANATPVRADDVGATPFVPGDISIGEPIVLPADQPPAAPATVAAPTPAAAVVPGNGWLGISLTESATPGRWVVAEVVPGSPAAEAGIRAGDDVRAINGTLLRSGDDVAQSLTAIAAGQPVSVAIARGESVADVRMTAAPRPTPAVARGWQASPGEVPFPTADRAAAALPTSPPISGPIADLQPPAVSMPSVVSAPAAVPLAPDRAAAPPPFTPAAAFAAAPATGFAPAAVPQTPAFQTPIPAAASASAPAAFPQPPTGTAGRGRTALGVRTLPVNADTQARFRLPALRGAYVIGVVQDLPAARAGLPPGSVIVALDARPVTSPDDLTRLVTAGPVGRPVSLEYVLPGGESKQADVVLQPLELPLEQALVGGPTATVAPTLLPSPAPAAASPTAESFPYRANRAADAAAVEATREELRYLRARIEALERALGPAAPRR
jgi:membrane-associated protease RseP (regulator of RpoE activity)